MFAAAAALALAGRLPEPVAGAASALDIPPEAGRPAGIFVAIYAAGLLAVPSGRLWKGDLDWVVHLGWMAAALPWALFGALFLSAAASDEVEVASSSSGLNTLYGIGSACLAALYVLRASRVGTWAHGRSGSRLWHGLAGVVLLLGCCAIFLTGPAAPAQQATELDLSIGTLGKLLNAVVLGVPAMFHLAGSIAPGAMTAFVAGALPARARRPGGWWHRVLEETRDALLAGVYVPWAVIASFLADGWLRDVLHRLGLGGATPFGFRLTIALAAPLYAVLLALAIAHACKLASSEHDSIALNTDRRREMLGTLLPGFWILLIPAVLCGTSLYALAVSAAVGPATQLNLFVAAQLPSLGSQRNTLVAEEHARLAATNAARRVRQWKRTLTPSIYDRTPLDWAYEFTSTAVDAMDVSREIATSDGLNREQDFVSHTVGAIEDTLNEYWSKAERDGELASDSKAQDARAALFDAAGTWAAWLLLEPAAAEPRNVATAAAMALLSVAIGGMHYVLLIEVPFWRGQTAWKNAERSRTATQLAWAEQGLRSEISGQNQTNAASHTSHTRPSRSLDALWIAYNLARDDAQCAKEIPVHTFKNGPDLLRKLAKLGVASIAPTVLGPAGGQLAKIFGGQ